MKTRDLEISEFTFDLRKALVSENIGANQNELVDSRRCPECAGVMGLSLLLTASQYDFYRTFLNALGIPNAMDFINNIDVLLRVVLLIYYIAYAIALYVNEWIDIELGKAEEAYIVIFVTSMSLFLTERLSGRFKFTKSLTCFEYQERLASAFINRSNFAGPYSAITVIAVYVLIASGMSVVMLFALTILTFEMDAAAFALVALSFASEVLYTLARFGRFKELTEQSWTAAYAASAHSSFTTLVSVPFVSVYIVFVATRQSE